MADLPGWNPVNKIPIYIDQTKVDVNLTDFPVRIHLSNSSGINGDDVTSIFDELTSQNVNDDFTGTNGDSPNKNRWEDKSVGGGAVLISGNKLRCSFTDGGAIVGTRYYLSGDFDIQVDFDLITWPTINGTSSDYITAYLEIRNSTGATTYPADWAYMGRRSISNTQVYYARNGTTVSTSNASGKYRVTRVGTTLEYFYWGGSSWTSMGTQSVFTTNTVFVHVGSWETGTTSPATVDYDNFIVNSGTIVWHNTPKQIAITESDGTSQCYIEIENWDGENQDANLWVKVSTVTSNEDTILYLYYDSEQSDNTTYIGDTGETPAQNVWDSNFVAVYHMNQDPSGGADSIKDSTNNLKHGTSVGTMLTEDLVGGAIGKSIDFDGTDDGIGFGSAWGNYLNGSSAITLESTFKLDSMPLNDSTMTLISHQIHGTQDGATTSVRDDSGVDYFRVSGRSDTSDSYQSIKYEFSTINQFTYFVGVLDYSNDVIKGFINGNKVINGSVTFNSSVYNYGTPTNVDVIGSSSSQSAAFLDGIGDEIRISKIGRSDGWLKSTYYSNFDELISFFNPLITFYFTSPSLYGGEKSYGLLQNLSLTITVSGSNPIYIYDAEFYTGLGQKIGNTISGTQSGDSVNVYFPTTSGVSYDWYVIATSSGIENTSSVYDFYVRYLCSGICEVNGLPGSGINIRLYNRDGGFLVGETTSAGTGTFYIDSEYNEEHYAIALHPDVDTNALIYDKIKPE